MRNMQGTGEYTHGCGENMMGGGAAKFYMCPLIAILYLEHWVIPVYTIRKKKTACSLL